MAATETVVIEQLAWVYTIKTGESLAHSTSALYSALGVSFAGPAPGIAHPCADEMSLWHT